MNMRLSKMMVLSVLMLAGWTARAVNGTNSIVWHPDTGLVDANVHGLPLWPLLEDIAKQTGWHIFVEPNLERRASAQFKEQPLGDALHTLLGSMNYAFVPETNGPNALYVFTTRMENATRAVKVKAPARHVSNRLMVKLRPGADIDAIAKSVGAKVIKRNDKLHIYELEFDNAADTDAALGELQSNPDVVAVDYDYDYDAPPVGQAMPGSTAPSSNLTLDPPSDNDPCSPIVGLIDTAVQPQNNSTSQFLLPQISVAGDATPSTTEPLHATAMYQAILAAVAQQSTSKSTKVRILPVNVYGNNATTTSWDVAQGIQAAVDGGATVLNMSLGSSGDSSVLDSVVADAASKGILMFAAAGNEPVSTPTYPAADAGVVAVTASQNGQLAPYADYGSFVSLELPGTVAVGFNNQAYVFQGTSVATALASGVAAGVKSANCDTWSQIESAMQAKFSFTGK